MMLLTQVPPGGWVALGIALFSLLGTVAGVVATYKKAVAPVELVRAKTEQARAKDDSKRMLTEHGLAAELLKEERAASAHAKAEADAAIAKAEAETVEERAAREIAERQASMYLAQNEGLLVRAEQAEKDAAEHKSCRELVASQTVEIRNLAVKVAECESRHEAQESYSDRMFERFEERLRALEPPHSIHPPKPERERSITPADMPAVPKEPKP